MGHGIVHSEFEVRMLLTNTHGSKPRGLRQAPQLACTLTGVKVFGPRHVVLESLSAQRMGHERDLPSVASTPRTPPRYGLLETEHPRPRGMFTTPLPALRHPAACTYPHAIQQPGDDGAAHSREEINVWKTWDGTPLLVELQVHKLFLQGVNSRVTLTAALSDALALGAKGFKQVRLEATNFSVVHGGLALIVFATRLVTVSDCKKARRSCLRASH
jgi:hypothetical protein